MCFVFLELTLPLTNPFVLPLQGLASISNDLCRGRRGVWRCPGDQPIAAWSGTVVAP
jgi:hypothetical protein